MTRILVWPPAALNLATLALDLFLRAFGGGSAWDGTESAGPSGARGASNGSTPPAPGTPINGNGVASFNGTTRFLTLAGNAADYMADETTPANGSFSGWVVFRASSAGSVDVAYPYNERAILADNSGNVGLTFSTAGFGAFHNTANGWKGVRAACAANEWHVGTFTYHAASHVLAVGIDGPPNHSVFVSPADASLALRTIALGKNFNASAFFHGDVEQYGITREQLTAQQFREIVRSVNVRCGLSLAQVSNVASAPVTGANSPPSTYVGTTHTSVAPYTQRDGAKLHYLAAHGKYFLLGGWGSSPRPEFGNTQTTNQVWSTTPGHLDTWALELDHVQVPPTAGVGARFLPAHAFGSCQFNLGDGAGECVYVIGSDQYEAGRAQVWRASNPGSNTGWVRRQAEAEFGRFVGLCVGSYGTEIHVVGGAPLESAVIQRASAQHWVSSDGGLSFRRLPDCPFRTSFLTQLVEHKGLLFVTGGNGGGIGGGQRIYQSAVWAWDGSKWHLQNANPGYPGAMWMNQISYDDRLWRIMGRNADDASDDDTETWSSGDLGVTWLRHPSPPWTKSHADGVAVGPDGIVVASGFGIDRRVYSFTAA